MTTTVNSIISYPGLAKFGIALGLGPRDRGFESRSPDQKSHHWRLWALTTASKVCGATPFYLTIDFSAIYGYSIIRRGVLERVTYGARHTVVGGRLFFIVS